MDEPVKTTQEPQHCDRYISRYGEPNSLRWYLFFNRLSATDKGLCRANGVADPKLWAKYEGSWVRVVMASRFGDVGITSSLDAENGYDDRVAVEDLTDFTDVRPKFEKVKK